MGGALAAALLLSVWDLHRKGMTQDADLLLRVITGFGVMFAVFLALFGDWIKTYFNRLHFEVEEPGQSESFLISMARAEFSVTICG